MSTKFSFRQFFLSIESSTHSAPAIYPSAPTRGEPLYKVRSKTTEALTFTVFLTICATYSSFSTFSIYAGSQGQLLVLPNGSALPPKLLPKTVLAFFRKKIYPTVSPPRMFVTFIVHSLLTIIYLTSLLFFTFQVAKFPSHIDDPGALTSFLLPFFMLKAWIGVGIVRLCG
jgi:hypothetical protein